MNIEKKYYYVAAVNELQALTTRQQKLNSAASDNLLASMTPFQAETFRRQNPNPYHGMSQYERTQEGARLEVVKKSILPKIVSALNTDWATVKSEYRTLRREQAGAADRSAKAWDFSRLAYEKQQLRDFLSKAPLDAITKKYNAVEIGGDRHALRALAETGLEVLEQRKFTDQDVIKSIGLRNDFEKMRDDLTVTKEQRDLLKQSSILTSKIADLYQATHQAAGDFSEQFEPPKNENGDYMLDQRQANPFPQMTQGVQVTRKIGANLEAITEVDVRGSGWDEPATPDDIAAETRAILAQKGYARA